MNAESTSKQKAGVTKKDAYRNSIINAFEQLAEDRLRKSLSVDDICKKAGLSSSPIYKIHHEALRTELDLKIKNWNISRGKKRKLRATESEQDAVLRKLKADNSLLRAQLRNAQDALNMLGQMLETALGSTSSGTVVPLRAKTPKGQ